LKIAGDEGVNTYHAIGNVSKNTFLEAATFGPNGIKAIEKHGVEKFEQFLKKNNIQKIADNKTKTIGKSVAKMTKILSKDLPHEAHETLKAIKKGSPYPFSKDGTEFKNFEKRLPIKESTYYQEFTVPTLVPTPNVTDRGAKRIVVGKNGEIYYTDDHYQTFTEVIHE